MPTITTNVHLHDKSDLEVAVCDIGHPNHSAVLQIGGVSIFFNNAATARGALLRLNVALDAFIEKYKKDEVDIGSDEFAF